MELQEGVGGGEEVKKSNNSNNQTIIYDIILMFGDNV